VVKFFQDQLLKFVSRFALARVDAGLSEQFLSINFGLRQQQPKADVLRCQKLRGRCCGVRMALI
jgi:hypothetical protein